MKAILTLLSAVALLAPGGCGSGEETSVQAKERIASVKVANVKRGDLCTYINVTGTLSANRTIRLGPKVEGRIEEILADEGDRVKRGQPLIKLDQETYRIALTEARTALDSAEARRMKAKLNLDRITVDHTRFSKLHRGGTISEQEYDGIRSDFEIAQTEFTLAKTMLKETEARLSMAQQNLRETVVYAPFDGFVVRKLMEAGENSNWVTYLWEVLQIEDISKVRIESAISEKKLPFVFLEKKATITVDAYPDLILEGSITTINPSIDPESGTFIIKIEIPNPGFTLRSGMFARVRMREVERKSVLQIPTGSLLLRNGRQFVFLVEKEQVRRCTVRLGIASEGLVEVIEGLKEGQTVVSNGIYALGKGTKIRIIE